MQSPHYRRTSLNTPPPSGVRVLLCYKNFAAFNPAISHIGLGVSAQNTAKVLVAHGVAALVRPITAARDIPNLIRTLGSTHVVISAPWIPAGDISTLCASFPDVHFAVNCHSNVGFLQADPQGVALLRQYFDLEQGLTNFAVSANSVKGAEFVRAAFRAPCEYLPNLYYLDHLIRTDRPVWRGGVLRIGAFGATRPLKNLMSAAGAAMIVANELRADTEFHISGGRPDGGAGVVKAIQQMLAAVPNIGLVQDQWLSWPAFRDLVRHMNLLLNVSYSESFNMVCADGIAEGVPSVTSDAIAWVPRYWQASADETVEIARIGRQLLTDPGAPYDGFTSLERHNASGFDAWCGYIGIDLRYVSIAGKLL